VGARQLGCGRDLGSARALYTYMWDHTHDRGVSVVRAPALGLKGGWVLRNRGRYAEMAWVPLQEETIYNGHPLLPLHVYPEILPDAARRDYRQVAKLLPPTRRLKGGWSSLVARRGCLPCEGVTRLGMIRPRA
jgi:hypothetical protein